MGYYVYQLVIIIILLFKAKWYFIHMYMQQQLGNQIAHMKGQPQGWNDTS